ncbi:SNF1-related kinase complex anchoring protein SIP1 [Trichosporon asahii var. asahii CBS 8904]|uniref:SNF1-related kinase complex anchoring protein SIP1 n=1 Tax=Trichosporon asahii var. asahii (strain CBS 8904) TaxID=1220162 RepID=K1VFI5_TRIAC|nr:SNF1-related kinase complex anchoring protein SIP1 [Trichosporon asahii var. asahii CBS 8904]
MGNTPSHQHGTPSRHGDGTNLGRSGIFPPKLSLWTPGLPAPAPLPRAPRPEPAQLHTSRTAADNGDQHLKSLGDGKPDTVWAPASWDYRGNDDRRAYVAIIKTGAAGRRHRRSRQRPHDLLPFAAYSDPLAARRQCRLTEPGAPAAPRAQARERQHAAAHWPEPPPPTVSATPQPTGGAQAEDDGLVDVPIQWTGGGRTVLVTGNFADNWRGRIKLRKSTHDFNTVLRLAPGQYRLKFLVDDSWRCSKSMPTATDNDGTLVNYIEVEAPKSDADQVGWAVDDMTTAPAAQPDDSQWTNEIPPALSLYAYLEELPGMLSSDELREYVRRVPYFSPVPKPPQLPRILERVILNQQARPEVPVIDAQGNQIGGSDDNAVLPTPSSSVLGHLLASAVRGGSLGLATTTRYRKKYITTVLFRPIHEQAPQDETTDAAAASPSSTLQPGQPTLPAQPNVPAPVAPAQPEAPAQQEQPQQEQQQQQQQQEAPPAQPQQPQQPQAPANE